jgi:hypothetical protein
MAKTIPTRTPGTVEGFVVVAATALPGELASFGRDRWHRVARCCSSWAFRIAESIFRRRAIVLGLIYGITGLVALLIAFDNPVASTIIITHAVLFTLFILRFGLLATSFMFAVSPLLYSFQIGFDPSRWWATIAIIPFLILASLAVFGYLQATAPHRPMPQTSSRSGRA